MLRSCVMVWFYPFGILEVKLHSFSTFSEVSHRLTFCVLYVCMHKELFGAVSWTGFM